jgi:hypothetical protein
MKKLTLNDVLQESLKDPQELYRIFSSAGNQSFCNITRIIDSSGYKIRFERQTVRKRPAGRAKAAK